MMSKRIERDMDGFAQVESLQKEAFPPNESYSMTRWLNRST